jgi:hypothetical protein
MACRPKEKNEIIKRTERERGKKERRNFQLDYFPP